MTHQMGKFLGNHMGDCVLTDQSRKEEQFGSILRIRIQLDIRKPLRRYVALQLEGQTLSVDIQYEKLPLTCFLCGIMVHVKDQCEKYHGRQDDDYAQPYGRWFQDYGLGKEYRKPAGKWFGLGHDGN